jgi:hypothetical protein
VIDPFVTDHCQVDPVCDGTLAIRPAAPCRAERGLVIVGAAGLGFTTRPADAEAGTHPASETVTVYFPAIACVTLPRVGRASLEVKPFGPDQEYDAPRITCVENCTTLPSQAGPVDEAVTIGGGLTVAVVWAVVAVPK